MTSTEPVAACSPAEHLRISLPYFLQRFEVNPKLELVGSPQDLAAVIQAGPHSAQVSPDGKRIEVLAGGAHTSSVPLALDADQERELLRLLASPPVRSAPEAGGTVWYGLDGRLATVRTIKRD